MPVSEAQKRAITKWQKKNTVTFTTRLQKSTDADILEFLEGKAKATVVKAALREYMENHKEENYED